MFGVPIAEGGYALGVVARSSGVLQGAFRELVCYFFGPRLYALPEAPPDLQPEDTVWIRVFDNQAIEKGDWPVIGTHPCFDRMEWPAPDFCRRDDVNQRFYRHRLHPNDPSRLAEEIRISEDEAARLPTGGGVSFSTPQNKFLLGLLQDGPIDPSKRGTRHARSLDWARVVREAQEGLRSDPMLVELQNEDPQSGTGSDLTPSEHAVILYLPLLDSKLEVAGVPLRSLEERLADAIEMHDAGEFDGDVLGPDDATIYMYGPDADLLFAAIEPVLKRLRLPRGSHAVKRYGGAGDAEAKEIRFDLGE